MVNKEYLYLLDLLQHKGLEHEIERMRLKTKPIILPCAPESIKTVKEELQSYFSGKLKIFKIPIYIYGIDFQKKAWKVIMKIPYRATR